MTFAKARFCEKHHLGLYFIVIDASSPIPQTMSKNHIISCNGLRYIEVSREEYESPGPWTSLFTRNGIRLHRAAIPDKYFDAVESDVIRDIVSE